MRERNIRESMAGAIESLVDDAQLYATLRQWLITNIAAVLEMDPAQIEPDRNLDEHGLDSLQSVCLAGDLESWLGIEIEATAIWDYPTIESLCQYLTRVISASSSSPRLAPSFSH